MIPMSGISVSVWRVGLDESGEMEVPSDSKVIYVLEELGLNPETLVVKRNGKIVPEDETLEDGDEVEIIPVVSGG